jgi:hypothetical protein
MAQKLCYELEKLGLMRRNPRSFWASDVHLVPKGDSYRFTVDLRQINQSIVPRAWPMPLNDVQLDNAVGKSCYSVLEADNGYW